MSGSERRRLDPELVTRAPRAVAFGYLADPRTRPQWQASLRRVELLDEGEPRVGMRWVDHLYGGPSFRLRISALVPGEHWAEEGRIGPLTACVALDLVDEPLTGGDVGTRVRVTTRLQGAGPARALAAGGTAVLLGLQRLDLPRLRRRLDALG